MPRKGGHVGEKVRWFKTDACYIFHFLNAFEDRDTIVVDACRMNSLDMTGNSFGAPPIPHRWTLDLKGGTPASRRPTSSRASSRASTTGSPDSSIATATSPAAVLDAADRDGFSMLIKRDYQTGGLENYAPKDRSLPGEPVFVPRSAAAAKTTAMCSRSGTTRS